MAENQGKFVWYELMTSDCKAAESFYRSVIGWEIRDSAMANHSYSILSMGKTMIGGMMKTPEEAKGLKPFWIGYIGVDNLDTYLPRLKEAGGTVHRNPENIPGIGRFAVVSDPHGAAFILFQGSAVQTPPAEEPGARGHIGWHELYTDNLESAFAFYSGLFGWTKVQALDMGSMGVYQIFATGGAPAGGMMARPPQVPRPSWLYYINVESLDAAVERIKQAGGQILYGPQPVPGGSWIAQCLDPQGAPFAIVSTAR
ncbi:MAG TPA: VOC family protein [Acidobacteriaceae bacterium]|nr:VOC family protein [Acidobacteriaceae bacterium]